MQIITNSKLEKRVKELEILLYEDKKKQNILIEEYQILIDLEKTNSNKLEKQMIEYKDIILNNEITYKKKINKFEIELDKKNNEIINLKSKISELTLSSKEKEKENKIKIDLISKQFNISNERNIENNAIIENELTKANKLYENNLKLKSEEFINKTKIIEDRMNKINSYNDKLFNENTLLKNNIKQINLDNEIEILEKETKLNKILEEKYSKEINAYLNKLTTLTKVNDDLNNKQIQINELLINLRKRSGEDNITFEKKIFDLNSEIYKYKKFEIGSSEKNSNYLVKIKHLESLITNLKNDKNELNRILENNSKEFDLIILSEKNNNNLNSKNFNNEILQLKLKIEDSINLNNIFKEQIDKIEEKNYNSFKFIKQKLKEI